MNEKIVKFEFSIYMS